jgi:hypothetical protein
MRMRGKMAPTPVFLVIVAAVAALATGCTTAPPVIVVDRSIPVKKSTTKVSQPRAQTTLPSNSEAAKPLLLHWDMRKEGQ